jgi:nucleotide-binding universal stress UspA family protein
MTNQRELENEPRILVVLDASPHGLAALEAAARLAAQLRAELQGLFVEDVDLLRLARLPFNREVAYPSAAQRQLTLADVERTLRATAEQLRGAVSSMAERVHVKWSFQVARGPITRSALAAAAGADLLVMGRECRAPRQSRASEEAQATVAGPILCVYDGSQASRRAVDAAARLAGELEGQLLVLLVAEGSAQAREIRADLSQWLAGREVAAATIGPTVCHAAEIAVAARRYGACLVVLNRDSALLDEPTIEGLVRDLDCPVGLVR